MELSQFELYLESQNLAETTINAHMRNIKKFAKVGRSQKIMVKKLDLLETWSKRLSAANSLSKYLQFKQQPNNLIVQYIHEANDEIQKDAEIRQKEMGQNETLPTLREMKAHTNSLFDKGNYLGYCVMYLFITFNVRNLDLISTVVKSKKLSNDSENFFIVGKNCVTYLRHKYKTADKYGPKVHIIKNPKFHTAISHLNYLLQPSDNIDRVVKNITAGIGHITQSTIAKIVLRESNNMNGISRVSKNRGTDLATLIQNYNITK